MTDQQFEKFLMQQANICSLTDDIHTIKTSIAIIEQNQNHNRELNAQEHEAMSVRLDKLEKSDEKQRRLIDTATGGGTVANWIVKGVGLLITALVSGLAVYLFMR